jgi:hypothetical protein
VASTERQAHVCVIVAVPAASFPQDEYLGLTTTTATELNSNHQRVVDRLLRPAFRILGVERQIEDIPRLSA